VLKVDHTLGTRHVQQFRCPAAGRCIVGDFSGTVGIYGVIAYSVSQRTREIGIRMTLGAQRGAVVGAFVRQGIWLTVVGIAIGLVIASATMRLMSAILYGC
jgi:ABC-type antimicrobial peptide transport system permease subunit